jgi:hypothetical protein
VLSKVPSAPSKRTFGTQRKVLKTIITKTPDPNISAKLILFCEIRRKILFTFEIFRVGFLLFSGIETSPKIDKKVEKI